MRRLVALAVVIAALVVGGLATILPASSQSPSPTESASASPTPAPSATFDPKPTVAFAPTPEPTKVTWETPAPGFWSPPDGYGGSLRPGVWVQITGTGSCLNARVAPGLVTTGPEGQQQPMSVLNCLPDGFVGRLRPNFAKGDAPIQADGHWWWYMQGQGWMAEDWLTYYHEDAVPFPPRPELAGAGLIAFIRSDGIWLANADGSNARNIVPANPNSEYVSGVRWSPDGQSLVYGVSSWNETAGQQYTSRIIDVDGTIRTEFPGIAEPGWSPDGRMLSGLRVEQEGGLGGYVARPVVIDSASGAETTVGPATFQFAAPIWSPDSLSVAFTCNSYSYQESLPDGTVREVSVDCGGDGLRVVPAAGGEPRIVLPYDQTAYYANPSWSPDGRTIAIFGGGIGAPCRGYTLVDVASASVQECLALGENQFSGFGCGGSAESGATDWSPDGRLLAYHWQSGQGESGIAVIDMVTGERTVVQTTGVWSVAFAPDGRHLVYGAEGFVWVAAIDGSGITLLGEGSLPAWQPAL